MLKKTVLVHALSIAFGGAALGLAVMASSRIWARMLDRFKGGQ